MTRARPVLIATLYIVACAVPAIFSREAAAQAGALAGTVSDSAGVPITGVEVIVGGAAYTARTDDRGQFRISAPVGLVTITARRIGFEAVSQQVQITGASDPTQVNLRLRSLPSVLKPVVVRTSKVEYRGRLAGYYRRLENQNAGVFIPRSQIDSENPRTLSQLLTHVAGINATRTRGGGSGVRMRGRNCWPLVWLDGLPMGAGEVDLDAFAPTSIHGIEIYLGSTTAPMGFIANRDQSSCGTILLWSRGPDTDPITRRGNAQRFDLEKMIASLKVYTADQVDLPAAVDPKYEMKVEYPPAVFAAGTGGSVVVEFVVDSVGRVEPGTLGIVSSSDQLLADAVKRAVEAASYTPARLKGAAVRQVVVQPFAFPPRDGKSPR
ncbi:MAG TPA: TonB family protein [Gemmatimonadaceae bacterium]|nr:TonB family protein [Gemmatimonadaceae bacterium]